MAFILFYIAGAAVTVLTWYLYADFKHGKDWPNLDKSDVFDGVWITIAIIFAFCWPICLPVILIFFALEAMLGDL